MKVIYADDTVDTTGQPPDRTTRPPHGSGRRAARSASSARVGLRLARRELRRRPWRTALVVLIILIPTAAMTVGVTVFRVAQWTPAEAHAAQWGQADAQALLKGSPDGVGMGVYGYPDAEVATAAELETLRAALPPGSTFVVQHHVYDRISTGDDRTYLGVVDLPVDDPIVEGRYTDLRGRPAVGHDEGVISDDLADALDIEIGDTLHPDRLDRDVTVTGIATPMGSQDNLMVLGAPLDTAAAAQLGAGENVLIDLPGQPFLDRYTQAVEAIQNGSFDPRTVRGSDFAAIGGMEGFAELTELLPTTEDWTVMPVLPDVDQVKTLEIFWTYVAGGVALIVLGTIITAAFAISARRQLHTIGLLSATGASPKTIRRFLIGQGAVSGFVGAAIGIVVGLTIVFVLPDPLVDSAANHHVGGIPVPLLELIPILLLGTAGAAFAARIPARSASQISTLQALAGRRPLADVPPRLPLYGAFALLAGCALFAMAVAGSRNGGSSLWALVAITGGVCVLAGTWGIAPWVIAQLERWSGQWPETGRLAARSLSRNRVRSSAVVGAICAVGAVLVGGSTLAASAQATSCCENQLPYLQDDQILVESYRHSIETSDPDGDGPMEPEPTEQSFPTTIDEDVLARVDEIVPDARPLTLPGFVETDPSMAPAIPMPSLYATLPTTSSWESEDPNNPPSAQVGIATTALLDYFGVPDNLRRALGDGKGVAVTDLPAGVTSVEVSPAAPFGLTGETIELAGGVESAHAAAALPTVLISDERATQLGYAIDDGYRSLFVLDRLLTNEQHDDLDTLRGDLYWEQDTAPRTGEPWTTTDLVAPDVQGISDAAVRAGILVAVFLLMLAVVAVGLALAAKDSEDERQVLSAVGAPPRTLRRVGALRAVLLVLIASAIAIPAGLLPAAAIWSAASNQEDYRQEVFALDWTVLAFVLLVAPVLVGLIVWATGWLRDKVRPLRPDSFTFAD